MEIPPFGESAAAGISALFPGERPLDEALIAAAVPSFFSLL
ncbi:hypothetical protein NY78_4161 [Desulfovibrio sp. TomC]|nr:hypothetical protein NY78_4161 [Desulfovibrio sp. TomC]